MRDADGDRWWVKLLNNRQGPLVLVNEQIVGRCGALIGAPVCEVAVVELTDSHAGDVHDVLVKPGLAHGSRDIGAVLNENALLHRGRDDNARRHVGVYAMHDWCWGADSQWLYATDEDRKIYSHDHGYFFPHGPLWNERLASVVDHADTPHELQEPPAGLDVAEVRRVAARLEAIGTDEIAGVLSSVPPQWPVDDRQLETLGFFLERRAPQVAKRLLGLAGG